MFEKEAEKIAERKISNFIPQQWGVSLIRTEPTWETVEGAPHFYLNSLAKMWQEGAEFGYNKANEWYFVKDELPKMSMEFAHCSNDLIFLTKDCVGNVQKHFGYFNSRKIFEEYNSGYEFIPDKVIAWKEIVLPELPKESE